MAGFCFWTCGLLNEEGFAVGNPAVRVGNGALVPRPRPACLLANGLFGCVYAPKVFGLYYFKGGLFITNGSCFGFGYGYYSSSSS